MGLVEYIFCPEVGLYTEDVLPFFGSQSLRHRIVGIYLLEGDEASISTGLVVGFTLVEVEIDVAAGSEDDIMAFLRSLDTALFASPAHHGGVRSESAHQDLIPADELAPLAVEILLDAANHIAL